MDSTESVGVEARDASDAQLDAIVDMIVEDDEMDESGEVVEKAVPVSLLPRPKTALITIEDAKSKIGLDVLKILEDQFKGELTAVRHPDEGDLFD